MRFDRPWPVLVGVLVLSLVAGRASAQTSGAVTLQWTAPGDDSLTGTASRYDLRYSIFPITELNFPYCSGVGGLPLPARAGTIQRFTVYGLLPGLRYYFAMKSADERLNWSRLSNVVAFAEPTTGVDLIHPTAQFEPPIPNPARSSTGFGFALPQAAPIRIDVFDVQGRAVRNLGLEEHPAGADVITWDLRDGAGRRVAPGIYLVRARLGQAVFVRRVLVIP